jgi:hypothetical protein
VQQEIRQRQGLEDQILRLKQPEPDNCDYQPLKFLISP